MKKTEFDKLGDKHKRFEEVASHVLMPDTPWIVRMDGVAFHTFTKGISKPFDPDMTHCMQKTAMDMTEAYKPALTYVQSDEITMCFVPTSEVIYGGKISKLCSTFAAKASVIFNDAVRRHISHKCGMMPIFDARVFNVPSLDDMAENLLWRQEDAVRNSVSMACHANFSDKELLHKTSGERREMLKSIGIDWNDYPTHSKMGTFYRKEKIENIITKESYDLMIERKIPVDKIPKVGTIIVRSRVVELNLGRLGGYENLSQTLFNC